MNYKIFVKIGGALVCCLCCLAMYAQEDVKSLSWVKVAKSMPKEWYATDEAAQIAENVLKYQTPIGGWTKNTGFHKEGVKPDEWERVLKTGVGATFDNEATSTEMRFLAKVYSNRKDKRYRDAFLKGFDYILKAQYKNGGWPQFYPPRPQKSVAYSGCITYNDNAYVNVMNLLRDVFEDADEFKALKLNEKTKKKAREAYDKGIQCILDTQIVVDGQKTVWCAQHDQYTLKPAKARAYELPSYSGDESAKIVLLLMSVPSPSKEIIASVEGAVKWFEDHKIPDTKFERFRDEKGERDSRLVAAPGSDLWARFYDLDTGKPYFCDRDGIKKSSIQEIGKERRGGYSWYVTSPAKVLAKYPKWEKANNL